MSFTPKDGSGALFKNDKRGNDKAPDYRGDIMINGTLFEVAGWLKKSGNGSTFMSLSAKPKEERTAAPAVKKPQTRQQAPAISNPFEDDDIPGF